MSTRCQVKVQSEGLSWKEEPVMLYHHFDGYPSNILKLLKKAYANALKRCEGEHPRFWEMGRTGKAAAFIVASDVPQFEPEQGLELHGDIEYFYVVTVHNPQGGHTGDKPYWTVEVRDPFGEEIVYKDKRIDKWTDAAIAKAQ